MTTVEMITIEMDQDPPAPQRVAVKSIVVATDGSVSASAAFRAARLIADRSSAAVHVLSVLEPLPTMFTAAEGMMLLPPDFYQARDKSQRRLVWSESRQRNSILRENGQPLSVSVGKRRKSPEANAYTG